MKKFFALFLSAFFLVSCQPQSIVQDSSHPYTEFLDKMKNNQADLYYYIKDIDGNAIDDLIILENTKLSVYSYENSVKLIGERDFVTGTVRFFCSESNNYPGIFCFTAGGGINRYGYMTVKNGELSFEKLWEENYSTELQDSIDGIKELSSNNELISESKRLYEKSVDISFTSLK